MFGGSLPLFVDFRFLLDIRSATTPVGIISCYPDKRLLHEKKIPSLILHIYTPQKLYTKTEAKKSLQICKVQILRLKCLFKVCGGHLRNCKVSKLQHDFWNQ